MFFRRTSLLIAALTLGVTAMADDPSLPDIMNATQPGENLLIGGQPTRQELRQAREAGVEVIVNMRGEGEFTDWDIAAEAESLGMKYVHIPIASGADLSPSAAQRLDDTLAAIGEDPALMHCASGNRVGALFALRAGLLQGHDVEEAIAIGREHGLTGLEPVVRARLREHEEVIAE
jgi:uncharacterized protein (TIGR01244 family)